MGYLGIPDGFWIEMIIILSVVILLVGVIPAIFRYRIGASKNKWFSNQQINTLHKKIDWILCIVFVISIITSVLLFTSQLFIPYILSGLFVLTRIGVQTYMEWKFSDNRKDFQVSLLSLTLTFVCLLGFYLWLEYFS
ncbi:DUF4181 domain-containing protein [Sporosarcina sp. P1]|uniref:DUF4181 domain-containing protein n=1 Tax=Sporosarcina sp. P1 TaxID=2048257 RepID=UPI000C173083|nr:hypothetical protein CSV73_06575 [Sporosarcina sp. P1]